MTQDSQDSRPVGIFDSGVGGLTIARSIRELLPAENLTYVADLKYAPYGGKSAAFISERSRRIVDHLVRLNVKAIVIACNTATVSGIESLRSQFSVPIVGVEPGIKPATRLSSSNRVGILATERTIQSEHLQQLVERYAEHAEIYFQACPGLVDCIESGALDTVETTTLLQSYITPLLMKNVDTLVLGCTHYAFLLPAIKKIAGNDICVINTATAVARQLERRLVNIDAINESDDLGVTEIRFCSGNALSGAVLESLWAEPATMERVDI